LLALLVLSLSAALAAEHASESDRIAVLVPVRLEASWEDDAFLAAVPAASVLGNGEPIVLALDSTAPWRPELVDFLKRFAPSRLLWLGAEPSEPAPANLLSLERLPAATAAEAAAALAAAAWSSTKRVVLYDTADRAAALAASALAGRLGEPLFPSERGTLDAPAHKSLEALGPKNAIFVGGGKLPRVKGLSVRRIGSAEEVVRWLVRHGFAVDYLAAVNPREAVAGRNRHLSLAAPILAVGRMGAVVPLPYTTRWKLRFEADKEQKRAPSGTVPSAAGWRRGEVVLDEGKTTFLTGQDPASGRWWLQLDRNRDGRCVGKNEQPVCTGEDIALGGLSWTADLDAEEGARGQAVWLTSPTAADIRTDLERFHAAANGQARFLCLLGWPEALPMAVISHGQGIDADLVSDLPFGQTDSDPFVELATARFVAEDLPSATLLACRGFARDEFPDQSWRGTFATAEWAGPGNGLFEKAGLRFAGHHAGGAPFDVTSPLTTAELLVHGSHAMWTELGKTYTWDSNVLLAPALVESSGCSTASLDQDAEHRSVATRLLRNGAVAFVGNKRRGVAQGNLFRSELWNALLDGSTLGEANRAAQNCSLVAVLEKGEANGGLHFYQLYSYAVYGDPALQLDLVRPRKEQPARIVQRGTKVAVHAPERWHRVEYAPNEEWNCPFPRLYTWTGAGTAMESFWYGPQKRNEDILYVNVEVRTKSRANTVEPVGKAPAPLGWTGSCFIDEHADGSRSLCFRVRMMDGDMTSGEIRAKVDRLEFRIIAK
jgi:hypothetical protein